MRNPALLLIGLLCVTPAALGAIPDDGAPRIWGHYVEARSCDVYTGYCFANGEMGLTGEEAILSWTVAGGVWKGTELTGLSVIAVVKAQETLGDMRLARKDAKAVLIVDEKASVPQRAALRAMAVELGGKLLKNVVDVKTARIDAQVGVCAEKGCALIKAEGLVEVDTRCLKDGDHVCGNEETYYPPLTEVDGAMPAYTEIASYQGDKLGLTWREADRRSAFIAAFAR